MPLPTWAKGSLLLLLALLTGVVLGMGYERRRVLQHGDTGAHHMLERLTDRLELDSAQQASIAAILARRQGTVDSTWHVLEPHVRATMDSTLREIMGVLRPDQAAKYRAMVGKRHPQALH